MSVSLIPVANLALSFLPLLLILYFFYKWSLDWKELLWGCFRMVIQLIGIGYVLTFIFKAQSPLWWALAIMVMVLMASWISLRSIKSNRSTFFCPAFLALILGSIPILFWTTAIVLPGERWKDPTFLIPLAGIFSTSAMNAIGIAVERFTREIKSRKYEEARNEAFQASLIREINMLFAVGLVSLPGLMTGQILSGVDPLIAVRYQIVIMTMVLASTGLSSAGFLILIKNKLKS